MNENRCRVTVMPSEMPRRSSASAMSSADRVAVPRSMTFDSRYIAPGASAGSQIDPARMAMLIVTAGVVRVRLARTTRPLPSVERAGTRPDSVNSGRVFDWQRVEPAHGAVRLDEHLAGDVADLFERDARDPRTEIREHVDAR